MVFFLFLFAHSKNRTALLLLTAEEAVTFIYKFRLVTPCSSPVAEWSTLSLLARAVPGSILGGGAQKLES
jgi:hypothetical protein